MKKKYLFLFISAILMQVNCYSQAVISSGGGNLSSANGIMSYSFGQVVTSDETGSTGLVGSGFQQPYEKVIINGLNDDPFIDLEISTFPNPVNDILRLKSKGSQAGDMTFRLFNSKGDLLLNRQIDSDQVDISMKNYSPGTYIINVYKNSSNVRSIKIIKN